MRKAFVVGLAEFEHPDIEDLPFAANDATRFYEVITDPNLGGASQNESVLVLSPTRRELSVEFGRFFSNLTPQDEYILFLAGHGRHLRSGRLAFDCRDTDPRRRSLSALSEKELRAFLHTRNVVRGILILDTCFAGSFGELQQDWRARGDVEQLQIDPANNGQVILWACGSRELTFEGGGAGMFSSLLIQSILAGAGVSRASQAITPADALRWVKDQLQQTQFHEKFWPGMRSGGDVAGLFLSNNPNFQQGAGSDTDFAAKSVQSLNVMIGHLIASEDDAVTSLRNAALRLRAGKKLTHDETAAVIRPTTFHVLKNLAIGVAVVGFFAWFLSAGIFKEGWKSVYIAAAAMLATAPVASFFTIRKIRNLQQYFLLVTPQGFCVSEGGTEASPRIKITPWNAVVGYERRKGSVSDNVVLMVQEEEDVDPSEYLIFGDYVGGIERVHTVLTRFYALHNAILPEGELSDDHEADLSRLPVQASRTVTKVALLGSWDYRHLPKLTAPSRDLPRMHEGLIAVGVTRISESRIDSLENFERWIGEFVSDAAGAYAMVYFTGHGLLVDGDLLIAFQQTCPDEAWTTAFSIGNLLDLAAEARLGHLIVILDCCFSGAAGASMGLSVERNLLDLFQADKNIITILAGATDVQAALARAGHGSLFTDHLVSVLHEYAGTQRQLTVATLSDSVAKDLNELGLGQKHWRFATDEADMISIGGKAASVDPILELKALADAQRARLAVWEEDLAVSPEDITGGPIGEERDGHSAAYVFVRPAWVGTKFDWGCLGAAAALSFLPALFLVLAIVLSHYATAFWIGAPIVLVTFLLGRFFRKRPTPMKLMIFTRDGFIADGQLMAAIDVANLAINSSSNSENGRTTTVRTLVLTDRRGEALDLASSDERWSCTLDEMLEIGSDYLQASRTIAIAELLQRIDPSLLPASFSTERKQR